MSKVPSWVARLVEWLSCWFLFSRAHVFHIYAALVNAHDPMREKSTPLVAQRSRGPRLVIAVDAQQRYRHRVYVLLELFVAVIEVVVDAGVAEDYQHVAERRMIVSAEARDALKAPMRVAGEVDVHFFFLI